MGAACTVQVITVPQLGQAKVSKNNFRNNNVQIYKIFRHKIGTHIAKHANPNRLTDRLTPPPDFFGENPVNNNRIFTGFFEKKFLPDFHRILTALLQPFLVMPEIFFCLFPFQK